MANHDPAQGSNWPEDPEEPTASTLPIVERQTDVPSVDEVEEDISACAGDTTAPVTIIIPNRPASNPGMPVHHPPGRTVLVKEPEQEGGDTPMPVSVTASVQEDEDTPMPVSVTLPAQEAGQTPVPASVALPVIAVRNLTRTYGQGKRTLVYALRGVSLEVYPGEFVSIMGPSGSGKSTFMNLLGCLDRPTSGEYRLAGRLVSSLSNDELARMRNQLLGFVFQGFNLLGRTTAVCNVALPMVYAGISRRERERRARKVLHLVGLGARLDHKPTELSGGQQQRVAIARALVNGPSLLLADEPTGNLDSRTSIEIMGVLQALNEQGLTIVLVTHDSKVAAYAKRQVAFLDGQIVRDELVPHPRSAQQEWAALHNQQIVPDDGNNGSGGASA